MTFESLSGRRQWRHTSIIITMNIYAHVLDDAKRKLADRRDGLFGPTDVSG
jgi:integrase